MQESWTPFIQSLELVHSAALADNGLYPLADQAFICIEGQDAAKFLQGQLSCDMQLVTLTHSGLGSHSNAKGRMQSSFRICRYQENAFLLRTHTSITQHAKQTLAKYIVFSKATIAISTQWIGIGLHGLQARTLLGSMFSSLPTQSFQQTITDNCIIICTNDTLSSYEIYCKEDAAITLWQQLSDQLTSYNQEQHQLLEHQLGLAFVQSGTVDNFIPQMFNYQATPAISFKKGCYTGQEIVARMHYLGKIKRHMRHYTGYSATPLCAGDKVYIDNQENSIGDIVSSVGIGNQQWDLLINLTEAAACLTELNIDNGTITQLSELPLPYALTE